MDENKIDIMDIQKGLEDISKNIDESIKKTINDIIEYDSEDDENLVESHKLTDFNEETLKSIEDTENGKNLIHYESKEELYADLGLSDEKKDKIRRLLNE